MKPVSSDEIGVALLALLGIDGNGVRSAVITLEAMELVTVDVVRYASKPDVAEMETFKQRYELRALLKPSDPPTLVDVTTLGDDARRFQLPQTRA